MVTTNANRRKSDWQNILLPIVLLLTGLIMVGGDLLGLLSLDRIQNYWPLAVIAIGLAELIDEPRPILMSREEHVRQQ
jgi:hypothetical protein